MNPEASATPPERPPSENARTTQGGKLSADDLIILNEEIAGMARAGLPLDQGLAALASEMGRGRLSAVTAALAADLRAGFTLAQALERQGSRVPPYYANLMAVGVRTGRISDVLVTLTTYARSLADVRSTIIGAMFYPAVVLAFTFLLFGCVFFFLVPQWEEIFTGFRLKVPFFTEVLFFIGRHPIEILVIPPLALLAVPVLIRTVLMRGQEGQRLWARMVYSLPIVGKLFRSARLAAFTELLGILVDQKVPLPEAFRLAGQASSDPLTAEAARQVEQDLSEGMPLGKSLMQRRLMPEFVAWMAGVGEKRNTLGPTLHQVASMYRRQVDMRSALLRTVLPPFLILSTAGIFAVLFVAGVMQPLLGLVEGLSGGVAK